MTAAAKDRVTLQGLRCADCTRPFRGPHAPTDYAHVTSEGFVHAHGCTPVTKAEAPALRAMTYRATKLADRLDRIEDLEWMAAHGETLEGAAARLGMRAASLETWLLRSHRPALVRALVGNARHVEAWS